MCMMFIKLKGEELNKTKQNKTELYNKKNKNKKTVKFK